MNSECAIDRDEDTIGIDRKQKLNCIRVKEKRTQALGTVLYGIEIHGGTTKYELNYEWKLEVKNNR